MQDCSSAARLPRHSDGGSGGMLPPVATSRGGKKSGRRKKGLATISAPLTPQGSGINSVNGPLHPGSPTHQQQQQQDDASSSNNAAAAVATTHSRFARRAAQSDTGQAQPPPQQQQHARLQHSLSNRGHDSQELLQGQAPGAVVKQLQWQQDQQQQGASPRQQQVLAAALAGPPPPGGPPMLPQGPSSTGAPVASTAAIAAATAAAAAAVPRAATLQHASSIETLGPDPPPTLWEFFYAEATPHEKYPTADVLWRQTERDRVYNFLLYVPYQLERIMIFGTLLCLYSFLGALAALPLRCMWALWQLLRGLLLPRSRRGQPGSSGSSARSAALLPGAQLYDLLCAVLMLGALSVLSQIKPGVLYYWMKDITSEFLKIQVLFTALEILDKILSNFGVDVLEALSSTCTLYTQSSIGLMQLLSDLFVAFLLITAHGSVLMCQAMVFAVTMNSKRNALLALMIATNFVELKGQVYKRTDTNKLWALACQDIVERFQLVLVLCFVVVEDISNSGTWWPAPGTLLECGRIFLWEIVIDITKHAVLGKFNDIRPGIYREYMRDLCGDSLDKHSHNSHKLVGFCPLGPAALSLRMVHTLFTLNCDGRPDWQLRCAVLLASWTAACVTQVVLGYSLKWLAFLYVRKQAMQAGGKVLPRAINVTPSGIKLLAPSGAPPTAVATAIKGPPPPTANGFLSAAGAGPAPAVPITPAGAVFALAPGLSPRAGQARTAGPAVAASGGSPLAGPSPLHSPKNSSTSCMLSLSGKLAAAPPGALSSSSTFGSSGNLLLAAAGSNGPQPSLLPQHALAAAAEPLASPSGRLSAAAAAGAAAGSPLQPLQLSGQGTGRSSSGDTSFASNASFLESPAMLAASLAANSAPPAVSGGVAAAGLSAAETRPMGATAAAGAVNGLPHPQAISTAVPGLPGRSGVVLTAQRADSTPESPFHAGSQVGFSKRPADARASFSDARPGWGAVTSDAAESSAGDTGGAAAEAGLSSSGLGTSQAVAASTAAACEASSSTGAAGTFGAVSMAGTKAASAGGLSSSYAAPSVNGLTGRAHHKPSSSMSGAGSSAALQQQQDPQQREQEWQQPKGRHRAKRE